MAANTYLTAANNSTNALFRAWGQNISSTFTTCGWVAGADSGQINWATVAAPSGASASQGYEIWRMNDALQSTSPVFLKIEYGSSQFAALAPGLFITIARATDGAGTVTGNPSARMAFGLTAGQANSTPSFFSGANNRFATTSWIETASAALCFSIERTHDAAGADTGEGVLLFSRGQSTGYLQQYWNCAVGPSPLESTLGALSPGNTTVTGTTGNKTVVYPFFFCHGVFTNPSLCFLSAREANFTQFSTCVIPFYGGNHTYMPTGSGTTFLAARSSSGNTHMLMLYE